MKFLNLLFLFLILFSNTVVAQEVLLPYGADDADSEFKNLQWNRYTSKNFVILSIDNAQGKWLNENIEEIKDWCLSRWGFPQVTFSKECRVFCVPNKNMLKKLFSIEEPKFEIRKDINVIWLVLDEKPLSVIPSQLTNICISEFESSNVKLGFWFKRGISKLNSNLPNIKQDILEFNTYLRKNSPIYYSEQVLTMSEADYQKESVENKRVYDQEAMILCLLLRKEFGEAKLQGFLRLTSGNDSQDVLKVVYGFEGYRKFDKQYIRFMKDLTSEVSNNRTPDSYLDVKAVY